MQLQYKMQYIFIKANIKSVLIKQNNNSKNDHKVKESPPSLSVSFSIFHNDFSASKETTSWLMKDPPITVEMNFIV